MQQGVPPCDVEQLHADTMPNTGIRLGNQALSVDRSLALVQGPHAGMEHGIVAGSSPHAHQHDSVQQIDHANQVGVVCEAGRGEFRWPPHRVVIAGTQQM
jgi:hypothetical protein